MSDSKKTYKKFLKDIKNTCNVFVGKDKKNKKQCLDTYMCNWNKCSNEYNDWNNSIMTDEDYKKCENKDYKKQNKCIEEFHKKNDVENKYARYTHCVANKCPESVKITTNITNKFRKEILKLYSKDCNACDKELQQANKHDMNDLELSTKCSKKFNNFKQQNICLSRIHKKSMKGAAALKVKKCIMTKCAKSIKK